MKYLNLILKIIALLFWVGVSPIQAMELSSFYEFESSIPENTGGIIDQASLIRQGIKEVLVQVSGSEGVLQSALINDALTAPDKYVTQLSYHQRSATERSIKILFNEKLINQLLGKAEHPVWRKQRPLVLVWLMTERDSIPCSIAADTEPVLVDEMSKALTRRAIPFTFPLLDLTDITQVAEQEVWNGVLEPLQQGAKRYEPDVILLGRLKNPADRWQSDWTLLKGNENIAWSNEGKDLNTLLNEAVEALSVRLVEASPSIGTEAGVGTTMQRLSIAVADILTGDQYTKVLEYLRQLPAVTEVEVIQVMPEKTMFSLQTTEHKETLMQFIREGNVLIEKPPLLDEENEQLLSYKVAGAAEGE